MNGGDGIITLILILILTLIPTLILTLILTLTVTVTLTVTLILSFTVMTNTLYRRRCCADLAPSNTQPGSERK